jgi:STE24 endopeptidase
MTHPIPLDQSRQEQAREYARLGRKLMLLELGLGAAYVLFWIFSGLSPWLRDQIYPFTTSLWLAVPLFALGFGLPYTLIDAPLSYYSGFVLPHRYGQSTQSRGDWLTDQAKGLALSGVIGLPVLGVIYGLLAVAPQSWWLWATAAMLVFSVVLGMLAPVLIFPLFFKYTPLADEELAARLTRLFEQAGTRVKGVYAFDMSRKTVAANAALMGLGSTRRIILGDTLLTQFTHDEIETVLAHELGHHVHHDLPLGILVQAGLTLAGFWLADVVMRWGVAYFGYSGLADPATLPLLMVALSIFGLVTMPLSNAWSRWREVLADRYALETTANPPAFINAMTRLANQNLAEAEPPAWVEFLLHSHPSITKRVALAQTYQSTP